MCSVGHSLTNYADVLLLSLLQQNANKAKPGLANGDAKVRELQVLDPHLPFTSFKELHCA